jgi:hypothetical protein
MVTESKVDHQNDATAAGEATDWREEFRERPVAWSLGAVGAGFVVGYALAALLDTSDDHDDDRDAASPARQKAAAHRGPITLLKESHAYDLLRQEAVAAGKSLLDQLTQTAKEVLLPVALGKLREWLTAPVSQPGGSATSTTGTSKPSHESRYQPVLERNDQ